MHFSILGNPVTKKNSARIVTPKGYKTPISLPSKQYIDYEKEFCKQAVINKIANKNINIPLNIKCVYFMQTRRKVDLTNLLSATMDCLVKAKVIEDDNCHIASSNDGSYVTYDKTNPRVEITITRRNDPWVE